MDSLKEKDKPETKPSKRPRIEVDEELMRQMIAGQALMDSRPQDPESEEGAEETVQGPVPNPRLTNRSHWSSLPLWLQGRMRPGFVVKSSCCRISNARSSLRWIAVTARQSMSVPKPRAKCRKSSTCWEMTRQGLQLWSTICCGSPWTFTATS